MRWLVLVFAIAACGGSSGNIPPGGMCSFDFNSALMCQSDTGCHVCLINHGADAGGQIDGTCRRPCPISSPDCPAGQTCVPLSQVNGYFAVGCGSNAETTTGVCM